MGTWFECKIKYNKIDEHTGKDKTVTEPYLVDAMSFTEAEERICKQMESEISGEFTITSLSKTKIEEIYAFESDGIWFKCKVAFIDVDEKSGKEKKNVVEWLLNAEDFNQACERLKESLKDIICPWTIKLVQETAIIDVYPYFEGDDMPDYLKEEKKKDNDKKKSRKERHDEYLSENDNDIDAYYDEEMANEELENLEDAENLDDSSIENIE